MRRLPSLVLVVVVCGCNGGANGGGQSPTPAADAGSDAEIDTGVPDTSTEPDTGRLPPGAECRHGQRRQCGVDIGVCRRVEQVCSGRSWQPCGGELDKGHEVCDGEDNDCNGLIDDGLGINTACTVGEGACVARGTIVCDPDTEAPVCSATPLLPAANTEICEGLDAEAGCDICNQLDDDCDGRTDEHIVLGEPCQVGVGACRRSGETVCAEDGSIGCSVEPGQVRDELCGDNRDNDCDGQVDEGFDLEEECAERVDGCPLPGRNFCSEDQAGVVCRRVPPEEYPDDFGRLCAPVAVKVYPCSGQIDIAWTLVPGARTYRINFGIEGGVNQAEAFGGRSPRRVDGETATLRGWEDGTHYWVQLANEFGNNQTRLGPRIPVTTGGERAVEAVVDNEDELVVPEGSIITMSGTHSYRQRVVVDGLVCVEGWRVRGPEGLGGLVLEAPTIEVNGAVVASALGHVGGDRYEEPAGSHANGGGGGYGGAGGTGDGGCDAAGGLTYGDALDDKVDLGSGGGGTSSGVGLGAGLYPPRDCARGAGPGGTGGGAVTLRASQEIVVRGDLLASGSQGGPGCCQTFGGGGSGGGIVVLSPRTRIHGRLIADGGGGGGGGGGGRIKVFGQTLNQGRSSVHGGRGNHGGAAGEPGTVHAVAGQPR